MICLNCCIVWDYGCESPYGIKAEDDRYEIPGNEFEGLFLKYFNMDAETLQKRTVYHKENQMYQYRPRGMHDVARITNIPYPEVVDCIQNSDGTLTLTVDAIWPAKMMDQAFSHQVVISSDGGRKFPICIQYGDPSGKCRRTKLVYRADGHQYIDRGRAKWVEGGCPGPGWCRWRYLQ